MATTGISTPTPDISIRRFTGGRDVDDIARLQGKPKDALRRWLGQPNLRHPDRHCLLAERDGRVVDYAYLIAEPAIHRGVLLASNNDADAARALLDASVEAARGRYPGRLADDPYLAVMHIDVPEADAERRAMCASAGMSLVRTHLHMARPGNEPTGAELPAGMSTRLATRADVPVITDLQNAAFTGSWGYSPNDRWEIEYRIFDLPNDPPDPVVLLEVAGVLRSYCWTHREDRDSPGMVGMVGVAPDQQNKGYGKLATAAGIDQLVNMGATPVIITVDSANGPAVHVYESLGFALDWRSVWYEARLG